MLNGATYVGYGQCRISGSDLASDVDNMMTLIAQLRQEMELLKGGNVSANQLSEFSTDMGNIFSGVLGQATIINTTQDYGMYAYSPDFVPIGPIQVTGGTVTIDSVTLQNIGYELGYPAGPSLRTVGATVDMTLGKPGLYLILGAGSFAYSFSGTNNISYKVNIRGGSAPNASNEKGSYYFGTIGGFAEGTGVAGVTVRGSQRWNTDTSTPTIGLSVNPSGFSETAFLRMEEGEKIQVELAPQWWSNVGWDVTGSYIQLETVNVVAVRISGL